MKIKDEKNFLHRNIEDLKKIIDGLNNLDSLDLNNLKGEDTALLIVDMVNGFVRHGNLKSNRIESIVEEVALVANLCNDRRCKLVAFCDSHEEDSIEFKTYSKHCLKETDESELIDELKNIYNIYSIKKSSTNGFIEEEFQQWLKDNNNIKNFIIVGNCTDICVMQLTLSLKSYFIKNNRESNIIIPINSVETFDAHNHNGDLMNIFSLALMKSYGINIVSKII